MIWVVATLLPLAAFAVEFLLGKRLGRAAAYLSTLAIGAACLLCTAGLVEYMVNRPASLRSAHHGHDDQAEHAEHGAHAAHAEEAHAHDPVYRRGSFEWATVVFAGRDKDEPGRPVGVRLGYLIDNVSVFMFFMVTLIATCIHVYSIGYMSHEPRFHRFFMYLSLFCFAMLNLVLADNFFQIFISWELVGICSYLLIGFYYEKRSASNAANKAFITNRVGDVGFIVGLMILWANFGTFNFEEIFGQLRTPTGELLAPEALPMDYFWLTIAGIGIFVGCVGKSAQFPLHVWLPDAMEGPTPVSALIHAATMVAAGVYLVARAFPMFTPEALLVITYTGGITLFVAATIAIVATDIKKALAYSTISQLGYMMMVLGIGGWIAGLMHLLTHAFFKALLFLCSGSVIHGTGTQEMPQMGGLLRKMPWTAGTMLVGVLAIAGCPFFSGFYSKDAIIAHVLAYGESNPQHTLILLLPGISAAITAFYMFRLWFLTFAGKPRDQHVYDHAHESPPIMYVPLVILAFGAIVIAGVPWLGSLLPPLQRLQEATLENFLAFGMPLAADAGNLAGVLTRAHELHGVATLIASAAALFGTALAVGVYYFDVLRPEEAARQFPWVYRLLTNKWYFDELYRYLLVRPTMVLAQCFAWFDKRVIDGLIDGSARTTVKTSDLDGAFDRGVVDGLVNLIGNATYGGGRALHHLQTGWLRGYIMYIAIGSIVLCIVGASLFTS